MAYSLRSTVRRVAGPAATWLGCRKGNVALLFALLLPMAVGGAGLATEVGVWYHRRLELQGAADAAAYAAAVDMRAGATQTAFTAEALAAAKASGFDSTQGTLTVNWPPLSGSHQTSNAVEVLISENVPRFFSSLFINTALIENTRSVTITQNASNACVLALDTTASGSVTFSGSSNISLTGCSVMANSVSSTAITAQGATSVQADCLITVGGVSLTSGVSETVCSTPITQAPPVADPYAGVPTPTPTGACQSTSGNTLSPGTYCSGMSLKGNVILQPGTYYLQGDLSINANANVTGNGVTIFMQGSNSVSMNGNATVNISAPTSGDYSGVLFMGDRSCTSCSGTSETFNGTADSTMTGAIYFAKQNVNYIGNFAGANGCTQVVADTVTWNGHTHLAANCTGYGIKTLQAYEAVRFVE
ncbi:MAG TPA: pilus assembly protein TadG-related protein [Caulobacteraceae bacterium]|jgi:Flp pilus assembly protein TadG